MDEIIRSINHALDCAKSRLAWYTITGDNQYMEECKDWQNVANIYMNQLVTEATDENSHNQYGIDY